MLSPSRLLRNANVRNAKRLTNAEQIQVVQVLAARLSRYHLRESPSLPSECDTLM
jgi:hypothetical protein